MVALKSLLPLIFVAALVIFEERISIPTCKIVSHEDLDKEFSTTSSSSDSEDLKVMMVANLLLMGSEAGYINSYFRYSYMAKFFRKSFDRLKPDMLIVLGDISAQGSELTNNKWLSVLQQFQLMLGPFIGLPLHIVLGDRDVGECRKINEKSVARISSSLPGLDSAGCGVFEVTNTSFVSLNSVTLLCGNNDLRFSVEKVIEKESLDAQIRYKGSVEGINVDNKLEDKFGNLRWRGTSISSGSGPVLLLHFPLHRTTNINTEDINAFKETQSTNPFVISEVSNKRGFAGPGPYELFQTVPPNATEYIFQALKPRIIFSAHTHEFCDYIHRDGTREITVPAMTWDLRDEPGFVVATFARNRTVTVSKCSLARESHILMAYISVLVLLISTMLIVL